MNDRERILSLLQGETPDRVPWLADLTYWAHAMERRGEVPPGFQQGEAYYDFHRELEAGFYLQGYFPFRAEYDGGVKTSSEERGNVRRTVVETPVGVLSEEWTYLPSSFAWAPTQWLVKTPADLAILCYWFEHTHYLPNYREAKRRYDLVQDLGVVLCYLPRSPIMQFVTSLSGIATLVDLWMDATEDLEAALHGVERKHDEGASLAVDSPAECLMIPENLSSEVVGRSLFSRYATGYERKWTERIRQAGKTSFIHMDGTLRGLIGSVAENGFDVIEAVTPCPVGDLGFEEMRLLAGPQVILWGGLPGIYFTELVDDDEFDRFVRLTLDVMACDRRCVLGVADQVPPDGLRSRVARVGQLVEQYGEYRV